MVRKETSKGTEKVAGKRPPKKAARKKASSPPTGAIDLLRGWSPSRYSTR